ncbi:hypothetical protein BJ170DRAFT_596290 [Xylariales sp. AK1849]|nr:hypothetical protein BJ170DRAFT_596290 [Xylariales sp. AK1849]
MRLHSLATLSFLAMFNPVLATWTLDFYETGCPADGEPGDSVGVTAGDADDELWCIGTGSAHNVVATGIEADAMIVTLFSDASCTAVITDFETDGCKVIPTDFHFGRLSSRLRGSCRSSSPNDLSAGGYLFSFRQGIYPCRAVSAVTSGGNVGRRLEMIGTRR